ncbi:hypothetical protein BLNAU_16218 [Blattamonas nauphoetae]|uniref:C2HC/C3H-type domain-containing protein n=1 Tax=Blattamonas nauphoetae TaxID=2049346 RepID=A0ABQ9XC06_9EUKA|nr:hypothetical protein BLNAU_16218 [Blattamonas nauphoetae]
MPPPRAIPCPICGKMFFKTSLPIHQKQCEDKNKFLEIPCRYCDQDVRRCDMDSHIKKCPAAKAEARRLQSMGMSLNPKPKKGGDDLPIRRGGGGGGDMMGAGPTPTGLVPCAVCGRNFAPDRIGKHQQICRKVNAKKPRRVFNATKQRTADIPGGMLSRPTRGASTRPPPSKWRQEHQEFITAIREARRYEQSRGGGSSYGGSSGYGTSSVSRNTGYQARATGGGSGGPRLSPAAVRSTGSRAPAKTSSGSSPAAVPRSTVSAKSKARSTGTSARGPLPRSTNRVPTKSTTSGFRSTITPSDFQGSSNYHSRSTMSGGGGFGSSTGRFSDAGGSRGYGGGGGGAEGNFELKCHQCGESFVH